MTRINPDPLEELLERETRLIELKRALRTMSPQEQQVILRHQSGGQPLIQVATDLGISHSEAQQRLDTARRHIAAINNT
jgi:RNA polymerase sigma factor (sigma-70 family)